MSEHPAAVQGLLDRVEPAKRRRDALTMLEPMARATREPPVVDRNAVGFGSYDYRYASGHAGTAAAAGFAPRKHALVRTWSTASEPTPICWSASDRTRRASAASTSRTSSWSISTSSSRSCATRTRR